MKQPEFRRSNARAITVCGTTLASLVLISPVAAQIIPDNTLGNEGSVVIPDAVTVKGVVDLVEGGALRGDNLFHSFSEFNIGAGQQLYFADIATVENIISRVTGSSSSDIYGTLGVLGDANLFLINPNGIVFGPDAQLDVRGSFVASTADSIAFENGYAFSAVNPTSPPLLTVNAPLGIASWLPNAGQITNLGTTLGAGQDVLLTGQVLDIQGSLAAGRDLGLIATDTLTVSDTPAQGVSLTAANNFLLQGNQSLQIDLLSNPASQIEAGGNLTLRSDQPILTDAYFAADGNLTIEQLDGSLGSAISPKDPVFEVAGDFNLADFTGASLQILAGGSVTIPGNVIINVSGGIFNDSSVTLSNNNTLTLSGTTEPTLDVRAGTTGFFGTPVPTGTPTSADITIGSITVPGGQVFLTNQYAPNPALSGDISVGAIDTSDFGGGGDVVIDSRGGVNFEFINVSGEDPSTFDLTADAGDVTILAAGEILVPFVPFSSVLLSYGLSGGNITFVSQTAITIEEGPFGIDPFALPYIETLSIGSQPGGNILVQAPDIFVGGNLLSTTFGDEVGGSIVLKGDNITTSQATIAAGTFGSANSGNVQVDAENSLDMDFTFLGTFTESGGGGSAGNINIETGTLSGVRGSQISSETLAFGPMANAGNVTVIADDISLSGFQPATLTGGFFVPSSIISTSQFGAIGNSGTVTIRTGTLTLQEGATVGTSSFGQGNAGRVNVRATESITLEGVVAPGVVDAMGHPSNITSEIFEGATGIGGNINISTAVLNVTGGANISASTNGDGSAGEVMITATERASFDGRFSSEFVSQASAGTLESADGAGRDLTITTPVLLVTNGARLEAFSEGDNNSAGDITIEGDVVVLSQSEILTDTRSGDGGKITLNTDAAVVLVNGSRISTSAGTEMAGGDGGDISITTGLLVGAPDDGNNDITANAFDGTGGDVTIVADDVSGFIVRSREELISLLGTMVAGELDPGNLSTNDITAISQGSPRQQGNVSIATPDLDPDQGITNLPNTVVDASRLIAQGCSSGGAIAQEIGSLIVTGRGGLPNSPTDNLLNSQLLLDWATVESGSDISEDQGNEGAAEAIAPSTPSPPSMPSTPLASAVIIPRQIQEVQSLAVGPDGQVMLLAQGTGDTSVDPWLPSLTCAGEIHDDLP